MADTTALKNRIRAAIKANDNQEITGPVLQQALLDMVDELNGATETEASTRQNADSILQQGINTEREQRQNADSTLQQNINTEKTRAEGVEQNLSQDVSRLQTAVRNLRDAGYAFGGIAAVSTNPGVPTGNCFYIVRGAGIYTYFKNADDESIVLENDGIYVLTYESAENNYWEYNLIIGVDEEPTDGSNKIVKSGGVAKYAYCGNFSESIDVNKFLKELYVYSTNIESYDPSEHNWTFKSIRRNYNGVWDFTLNDGENRIISTSEETNVIFKNFGILRIYAVVDWNAVASGITLTYNVPLNEQLLSIRYSPTIWAYMGDVIAKRNESKLSVIYNKDWSNLAHDLTGEGWIKTNGIDIQVSAGSGYVYSDYIYCPAGKVIKYIGEGHTAFSHVTFYNAAKEVLQTNIASTAGQWIDSEYTAPANTEYVRLTYALEKLQPEFGGTIKMSVDILDNEKRAAILSDMDEEPTDGSNKIVKSKGIAKYSYCHNFTGSILANKFLKELYVTTNNPAAYDPSAYDWTLTSVSRNVNNVWSIVFNDGYVRTATFNTNVENENVVVATISGAIVVYMVLDWNAIPSGQITMFNAAINKKMLSLRYSPTIRASFINETVQRVDGKMNVIYNKDWSNLAPFLTGNGYIKANGIDIQSVVGGAYLYSDYLYCAAGKVVKYIGEGHTAYSHVTFYDEDKNVLETKVAQTAGEWIDTEYTAPANTAYLRLSYASAGLQSEKGGTVKVSVDILGDEGDIASIFAGKNEYKKNGYYENALRFLIGDGWIKTNGIDIQSSPSSGYMYSDYVPITEQSIVQYAGEGHTAYSHVTFYDADKTVLETNVAPVAGQWIKDEFVPPVGSTYVRFSYQLSSASANRGGYLAIMTSILNLEQALNKKLNVFGGSILLPKRVYSVLNDIDTDFSDNTHYHNNIRKNQFSSAIYLDHCAKNITEEYDIYFKENKDVKKVFSSPVSFSGQGTAVLNGGVNVKKTNVSVVVGGSINTERTAVIEHISTLNTATKDERASVLIIGDSVTFGNYANPKADVMDNYCRYSCLMEEMGVRDRIINGTYGTQDDDEYIINTMGEHGIYMNSGHHVDPYTNTWDGTTYSISNKVKARTNGRTTGLLADFLYNEHYSMSHFLSLRRNCDDLGVPLPGNAGDTVTGSDGRTYTKGTELVGGSRYWLPTHIVLAPGLNDVNVNDWYPHIEQFITDIKADYLAQGWDAPNIAVAILDTANTIFPSRHPNCSNDAIEWSAIDTRHSWQIAKVEKWYSEHDVADEDTEKVWLLPFFWNIPPVDSISHSGFGLPACDVLDKEKYIYPLGWGPSTHVNDVGHYNMAYTLYSWIKYTLAIS